MATPRAERGDTRPFEKIRGALRHVKRAVRKPPWIKVRSIVPPLSTAGPPGVQREGP